MTDDHGFEMTFRMLSDREYEMTRLFDAPRELIFAAYTDPKQIPRWWGPCGVTTIVDTLDVRPGVRRAIGKPMSIVADRGDRQRHDHRRRCGAAQRWVDDFAERSGYATEC